MTERFSDLPRHEGHPLSDAERRALAAVLARETGGIRNVNELISDRLTFG